MKNKHLFFIITTIIGASSFFACEEPTGTTYQDVRAIVTTSCAVVGCHNSITAESNVDFTNYATMSGATGRKNALTKGNNNFYDRVLVKQNMPPGGSLTQADKNLLQSWVDNNFKE